MPIDARIALGGQAPQMVQPMELYGNALKLQSMQRQNALAEQEMAAAQMNQRRQAELLNFMQSAKDPYADEVQAQLPRFGQPGIDMAAKLAERNRYKSETDLKKAEHEAKTLELAQAMMPSAIDDPNQYARVIEFVRSRDPAMAARMPPWSREGVINLMTTAKDAVAQHRMTAEQQSMAADRAVGRTETERHNRAMESIQSQQEARQGTPDPIKLRREATTLRKEFDALPEVKDFKAALPVLISARNAPDTAAGDIDLAYAVGKIYDPKSVVRESEQKLVYTTGSVLQKLLGGANVSLTGGTRLPAEVRQKLLNALNNRVLQFRQAYDQTRGTYEGYANQSGFDPVNVIGQHPASAYKPSAPPKDDGNWKDVP